MVTSTKIDLSTLRFDGARFEGHALDVECTQELVAYRGLVLACAKELWLRRNPDRSNLPRRFGEGFRVEFDRIDRGSATVPLQRLREAAQGQLAFDDEFDEAARLVDAAISAAARDELLPESFPANVVPLFKGFGRTLHPDETLFTRARGASAEAPYTAQARLRLADRFVKVDSVQIVSAADSQFDESAAPIWEELSTLGGTAPQGTWDSLPNDLASKINEVVYGQQGNG